jgi:hypothetical protein
LEAGQGAVVGWEEREVVEDDAAHVADGSGSDRGLVRRGAGNEERERRHV